MWNVAEPDRRAKYSTRSGVDMEYRVGVSEPDVGPPRLPVGRDASGNHGNAGSRFGGTANNGDAAKFGAAVPIFDSARTGVAIQVHDRIS